MDGAVRTCILPVRAHAHRMKGDLRYVLTRTIIKFMSSQLAQKGCGPRVDNTYPAIFVDKDLLEVPPNLA